MLEFNSTAQFRRDYKRVKRRGYDIKLLEDLIDKLLRREILDVKYKDHELTGNMAGFRECHIKFDWVLIYGVSDKELTLTAMRTGTHSEVLGV